MIGVGWLGVFGVLGVFSRYGADRIAAGRDWPVPAATLGVNAFGCLCAGFLLGVPSDFLSAEWRVPLMTGFLGGFTTYSAFSAQVLGLLSRSEFGAAAFYWLTTPVAAVACAWLGRRMAIGLF